MNKIVKIIIVVAWIGVALAVINNIILDKKMKQLAATGKSTLQSGPIQQKIKEETIEFKGVKITKLAKYDITGVVIAKEYYYIGGGANKISKEDLTLCWGPAVKHINDIDILFSPNDRKVEFRIVGEFYQKYEKKAKHYVSNNHLIPMNKTVSRIIKKTREGDTIQLVGYLVYCEGNNWTWGPSSMTRTDNGCEIVLVESAKIIK